MSQTQQEVLEREKELQKQMEIESLRMMAMMLQRQLELMLQQQQVLLAKQEQAPSGSEKEMAAKELEDLNEKIGVVDLNQEISRVLDQIARLEGNAVGALPDS